MYAVLKEVFEDTIAALTEAERQQKAVAEAAAVERDESKHSDLETDDEDDDDLNSPKSSASPPEVPRQKSKLQEIADFGAGIILTTASAANEHGSGSGGGGDDGTNDIISQLATLSGDDSMFGGSYEHDPSRYDPLYCCTPTVDEMTCYLSLCRVIFSEEMGREFEISEKVFQKINDAFDVLRAGDHAVAQKTEGLCYDLRLTTHDDMMSRCKL